MKALVVEAGKTPEERELSGSLASLQELVGGLIQVIYPFDDAVALLCNDEGKLLGMEGNRRLDTGSIIAGPFFVIGDAGENFRSLTDEEVNRYLQKYAEPEIIPQHEVQQDMGWIFY